MSQSLRRLLQPLALSLLTIAAGSATAQSPKIYRCGPDGRLLQQQPCGEPAPAGAGAMEPSAEERAAAVARAKQDAQLADRMERERLARERDEARHAPGAVGIGGTSSIAKAHAKAEPKPSSKKKPKHAAGKGSGGAKGDFSAISPATVAAKAKK